MVCYHRAKDPRPMKGIIMSDSVIRMLGYVQECDCL